MSERAFGVEIEHSIDDYDEYDDDAITGGLTRLLNDMKKEGFTQWKGCYDGSMFEIKSPILQGEKGFAQLAALLDFLKDRDAYCTDEDGGHIHFDGRKDFYSPRWKVRNPYYGRLKKLITEWTANRNHMSGLVPEERLNDWEGVCPAWNVKSIAKIGSDEETDWWNKSVNKTYKLASMCSGGSGRNDLHGYSLPYKGSIELRLMEGTVNYDRWRSMICFGQKLIDTSLAKDIPTFEAADDFFNFIGAKGEAEVLKTTLVV